MYKKFLMSIFVSIALVFSITGCQKQDNNILSCSQNEEKLLLKRMGRLDI
ncbi:hypothetical protein [Clostridium sp. ZS2-4]|nr:hypothetical protein [Clostridium sp. ZS2-4]MCY6354820.1 hypothetical protein [Clostridium sp. ZS2-4]